MFFEESTKNNGKVSRFYPNEKVYVVYNTNNYGLHTVVLLHSLDPGKGNARRCFTHFLATKRDEPIAVRITTDFTKDIDMLYKFYKSLGFAPSKSDKNIYLNKKAKISHDS